MKKNIRTALALLLLLALTLCSCSAKSGSYGPEDSDKWLSGSGSDSSYDNMAPGDSMEPEGSWDDSDWDGAMGDVSDAVKPQTSLAEKIIYSAEVRIETTDFDGAVDTIQQMLDRYGAFLESSQVGGKSYMATVKGYQTYRTAMFVIRVPVEKFAQMRDSMGDVGAVLSTYNYTENITERYYDTQSRADSYRIEQERLMAMLEKCETVSEMLEIESRLSEVRYQLESLESTLKNWQNQVDYSTITVDLSEVEEYTEIVETHRTYWQEITDGLKGTLRSVGRFFKELFKDLIINLPVILIFAVIAAAVILVFASALRRRKKRRTSTPDQPTQNITADPVDEKNKK